MAKILKTGFINVYHSGVFHRVGKPGTIDRHVGDIYLTVEEAMANIDPPSHYITTAPVFWMEEETHDFTPNPADSVPVPISITRNKTPYQPVKELVDAE